MLPILRILPVGGVFLAMLLLVLALKPPGERPLPLVPNTIAARGPQIDRNDHPEWREVLIQSAVRRADELVRLRDLPDTPIRSEPAAAVPDAAAAAVSAASGEPAAQAPAPPADSPKVAVLPTQRPDADPDADSITGSIDDMPGATIPVEIGEASSFELPVVLPEERPPIIRTPERTKPGHESRRKRAKRFARAKAKATTPPTSQSSFFGSLFNSAPSGWPAGGAAQVTALPPVPRTDAY